MNFNFKTVSSPREESGDLLEEKYYSNQKNGGAGSRYHNPENLRMVI